MNQIKKCLIIDGNNILYRCYHASRHLNWESEFKAIFIFLRVIIRLLKENNYQKLLIVFDSSKTNFRHQILPEYKIHRLATPPQLLQQMNCLQDLFIRSNTPLVKLNNFEADDLIASFVSQNNKLHPDWSLYIFSQDKDLLQLLSLRISIYRYTKREVVPFTYQEFCQEYNFPPYSYIDYLCLLGDKSDNISGVNGIGIKSAQELIQKFGTVENLYQNIHRLSSTKMQGLLKDKQQLVYQNKQLITLKKDLILPISWEQCDFIWEKWKNNQNLVKFCQEHQFKSVLKLLK